MGLDEMGPGVFMMRKRDWLFVVFALLFTWTLDRYTKLLALGLTDILSYGPLNFSLHYNPGAILGLFSQMPPVLRVVTLSTGGAFLIFTFMILQYLIPVRAMAMRIGMSLLLGGIIGNVSDRIAWGHVVDFISFRFDSWSSPIFNIADAIQWIGHGMVMYSLIRHADIFWPEMNARKNQWVNIKFQLKYCFILMAVGLGMGAVAGTLAYTYLRVTLIAVTGDNQALTDQFLTPFMFSFMAVTGIFVWILFLIGKVISLRVAGPVFAFERFVDDLLQGQFRLFKLRGSDEFQELNDIGERLKSHLENGNFPGATKPPATEATLTATSMETSLPENTSGAKTAPPSKPSKESA